MIFITKLIHVFYDGKNMSFKTKDRLRNIYTLIRKECLLSVVMIEREKT